MGRPNLRKGGKIINTAQFRTAAVFLTTVLLVMAMSIGAFAAPAAPSDPSNKTVAFIQVTGTDKVDPNVVLAAIKTKPGDLATAEKIRQDLRLIFETGYFLDVNADVSNVPEGVKIVYSVKENPVFKTLTIQGNKMVKTEKIASFITLKKDAVVNSKTLDSNLRSIEEYYKSQGYILVKTGEVKLASDGNLMLRINEGIVEDVVVKGNIKTKPFVVTREMIVKKGKPFNAKEARRSMQKLYNLGFFEDVNLKLGPGKEPGGTVVEVVVVEQKTGTFSIGGGYSDSDGLVGIIGLGDKNFGGRGDNVNIHWEFGGKASGAGNYILSFTRPWIDSKQTSASFSIYNMLQQYTDFYNSGDERSTYNKKYRGFEFTLGRPTNEYLTHFITFKNRWDDYSQYISGPEDYSNDPDYLRNNFGLTRSITLQRVLDTRDSIHNPSEGARYSLGVEVAGLGGDFNFTKYIAEARQYWKAGKTQVWALRAMLGYGAGGIPEMQKFAMGGSSTLRGYRDEQFKGNRMAFGSLEYRFPIAKMVQGAFFTDIGNAWQSDTFGFEDLKAGYGFGIRLNTPFGPVRIDQAWGRQGARTHFAFGGQF